MSGNNNPFLKDVVTSFRQLFSENIPAKIGKKLWSYIHNEYKQGNINNLQYQNAREVPKGLSGISKVFKTLNFAENALNYKNAIKNEDFLQATYTDGVGSLISANFGFRGAIIGPIWNKANDLYAEKVYNFRKSYPTYGAMNWKTGKMNMYDPLPDMSKYTPKSQVGTPINMRQEIPSNWQDYYNQPQNFKSLNIEKQLSIKNPVVQGISGTQSDYTPMQITYPQPVVNTGAGKLAWLGQLGNILSTAGRLASTVIGVAGGFGGSASGVPTGVGESIVPYIDPNMPTIMPASMRHTGGKITPQPITNTLKSSQSHDEVLAILRGGETVRTEAQEQELQGEKYKELMNFIGPMLEDRDKKPRTIEEAYDPNNKVPCLLNKTTTDEEIIISIIGQAWKSNRLGFRNTLRYE